MIDAGNVVPRLDNRERRADHPGPRLATAAVVPVVPSRAGRADRQPGRWCRSSTWLRGPALLPMIDAGKLVPVSIIQGHGSQQCRPCRSTAGKLVPSGAGAGNGRGRAGRADRRRERRAAPRQPGTSCPWCPWCRSTPGTWCRSSTWLRGPGRFPIDAGNVVPVPIIQGHGSQRLRWCPWCPSCRSTAGSWCRSSTWLRGPALLPMIDAGNVVPVVPVPIDAGNVVPRLDNRERRADHPGPRVATAAVVPAVPRLDSREAVADHRPGCAVLPIIQGHKWQRPRWCPWCRVVPIDSREGGADHPGPRLATAAVVPVVPIRAGRVDRQPGSWCRSSTWLRGPALLPMIDAGNVVPVVPVPIDAGNVVPRLDSREGGADHRPGCAVLLPMIDSREAGAGAGNGRGGAESCRPCRSTAGKVVPIIDLAARSCPVADDRRREAGARVDHPGPRLATVPAVPIDSREAGAEWCRRWQRPRSCRPCRSTPGTSCPWCPCRSTPGSWCRSSTWLRGPALLPIDSRERRAAPRQPGTSCPSCRVVPVPIDSREAGAEWCRRWQRPRWCPSCRSCRSTAGNVVPIIDLAARSCPVADD